MIVFSALRFKELSKRFFAIRLIFFLTVADGCAALFNVMGAFVDVQSLLRRDASPSALCEVQAAGLLYFNLASIMWTSCFAFTLYRDLVPSHRRQALRTYESYYHALCWPVRAGRPAARPPARPHARTPARPHARSAAAVHGVAARPKQVPAVLAGTAAALGYLGDSGPWCALGPAYSREWLRRVAGAARHRSHCAGAGRRRPPTAAAPGGPRAVRV